MTVVMAMALSEAFTDIRSAWVCSWQTRTEVAVFNEFARPRCSRSGTLPLVVAGWVAGLYCQEGI
jgi:hypothetical protein